MVYTKEEKKKQILNYLERNTKKENWFSLSKREVLKKFLDNEFDEQDITNILRELIREQRTDRCRISFDIRYPKSQSDKIKSTLKGYVASPKIIYFGLGLYSIVAVVASYPQFLIFLKNIFGAKSSQDFFILGILIGVFGSYSVGWLFNKIYDYLDSKIPLLHKKKEFFMPFIITGLVYIGIVLAYSLITKKAVEIAHIIALIAVTVASGFGYLSWKKK